MTHVAVKALKKSKSDQSVQNMLFKKKNTAKLNIFSKAVVYHYTQVIVTLFVIGKRNIKS